MTTHQLRPPVHDTLDELLQSGTDSNPALNRLLSDYSTYHVVLAVVGGCFLVALVVLSAVSWKRYNAAPRVDGRTWTFEKKTYCSFGAFSAILGVLLAVIVAANVSSVLDPRHGFAGAIGMLGTPRAGTRTDNLYQAFDTWLQSGTSPMPALIHTEVHNRLAWQRPKAVICTVLLVLFVWVGIRVWRTLIERSRLSGHERTIEERGLLTVGVATTIASLLLMLMVMGNTQASFAPLALTLFNG